MKLSTEEPVINLKAKCKDFSKEFIKDGWIHIKCKDTPFNRAIKAKLDELNDRKDLNETHWKDSI